MRESSSPPVQMLVEKSEKLTTGRTGNNTSLQSPKPRDPRDPRGEPSPGTVLSRKLMLLLRMRTKPTIWCQLQTWCQQLWQRLQTPRIVVQPPLQPGRHKPFPQRPHQTRRNTVFAALDAAPVGLTRRQLIAHVRAMTGIGCSEKLITQWRQGRKREGEKAKTVTTQRWRGVQLRLFLVCLLLGATLPPVPPVRAVSAQEITISPAPTETATPMTPRLLRIKLTINSPSDLLIKPDDEVKAGQVLTNRLHERQRLLAQRRILATQAQQIEAQRATAAASLALLQQRGATLPPRSFASEQAAITKAVAVAVAVQRAVEIQQLRVTSSASLVSGETDALISRNTQLETRNLITTHETAKLTFAQDAERQAAAEVALQKAKLTSAKETRAFAEKQHALELAKQLLTARQQEQHAIFARAQLLAQIAALDLQLAQLAAVCAPFAGKIRRIEYEDMHDQTLTVLVYLLVGSSR